MNVKILWICLMECMCAQTRPRFILSSKRFGGEGGEGREWSQNPCLLQGENPLYRKNSQRRIEPTTLHKAWQRTQHTTNWDFCQVWHHSSCLQTQRLHMILIAFVNYIKRVSNQNGTSLQWYIVEIYHSGQKPLILRSHWHEVVKTFMMIKWER